MMTHPTAHQYGVGIEVPGNSNYGGKISKQRCDTMYINKEILTNSEESVCRREWYSLAPFNVCLNTFDSTRSFSASFVVAV